MFRKYPNVIQLIDSAKTKQDYYIITEYYNGGSLLDFMSKKFEISKEVLQYLGKQMAIGINPLISGLKGIHRDLKPDNFMLHLPNAHDTESVIFDSPEELVEKGAQLVLCDFGVARVFEEGSDLTKTIAGTLLYWAPERWD